MKTILRLPMQFLLIMAIWQVGELLTALFLLPVPGSILGMLILLVLLQTGLLRESLIGDAGDLFLRFLPFFFIPAGVSILAYLDVLEGLWLRLILVLVISGILVMLVTGWTVQAVIRMKETKRGDSPE